MSVALSRAIAIAAAQHVVEDGLEYGDARRKAARDVAGSRARGSDLPRNEDIEDEVRTYLATFHGDTQPGELLALREVAARWMERLAPHRPHLSGAVWRGTATRRSAVLLDLYCDDSKAAEIDLINAGVDYDVGGGQDERSVPVLTLAERSAALGDWVTVHLLLHDLDDLRGALQPDRGGHSWRGDLRALRQRMAEATAT